MAYDEIWAASGMALHGGMLCLADLEKRTGRPLTLDDFTAMDCWERHVARRDRPLEPVQLDLLDEAAS